jgi:hypothetical protein
MTATARKSPRFDEEDEQLDGAIAVQKAADAVTATTATTATVAKTETPVTATPTATTEDLDDGLDLVGDHEALKAKPGLSSILPKEQGVVVRFALVPKVKAYQRLTHFVENAGPTKKGATVICLGEKCPECARGSEHGSRRKIAALVVKYATGNDGKFAAGTTVPQMTIGYIAMSPTAYSEISDCASEEENLYSIDLRAVKKASSIGWNFSRATSPTSYAKAGLETLVQELAAPYVDGSVLKSRLGKSVTAAELKIMIGGGNYETEASLENIEGLDD